MALSTQRAVSDGTMTYLDVTIQYQRREDITVLMDGVLAPDGSWAWVGVTDKRIAFTDTVPDGVEVMLQRATNDVTVNNSFTGGAKFNNSTMDSNFQQMLFISQEAREGSSLSDLFADLDVHGFRVKNIGAPQDDSDAVNVTYLNSRLPDFQTAATQAQAAATTATTQAGNASTSATAAAASASTASGAASTASTAATNAGNSATAAAGSASTASSAATAAGSSATAASTSASSASTSATAAAGSASDAATSESQAEYYAGQAASYGGSTPILFTCWFPSRAAIPTGYLPLDGQTFQRSTYPDAAAEIAAGTVPTVADATWVSDPTQRGQYTLGDGSTTCRLPDYNGKYDSNSLAALILRGDGNLSAGTAGAIQRDALQNITGSTGGLFAAGGATGVFTLVGSGTDTWQGAGTVTKQSVSFDASRVARTATETRMSNVTGVYCVKMAGVPINAGSLDLATLSMNMLDRRNNLNDVLNVDTARSNLGIGTRIDLSTLSSDVVLKPGQTGYYACAALGTVPFHVAVGDGQRYRLVWHRSDSVLGSNVPNMGILQVNNTTYTSRFFIVHKGYGNGAFSGSTGYTNGMTIAATGYCWDAFEMTIITDTAHKWIKGGGRMRSGGVNYSWDGDCRMISSASNGDQLDTTTPWTSFGTWVAESGTLTGMFTLTREM